MQVVSEMNYKSLFARFQKLFLGKVHSPVFEINYQYRIHPTILHWPNHEFYKNRLISHPSTEDNTFPIVPYKVISYSLQRNKMESDNIMCLIQILLKHIDYEKFTIGIICTNKTQNDIMRNKLRYFFRFS